MKGVRNEIESVDRTIERFFRNQIAGLVVTSALGTAFLIWGGRLLLTDVKGQGVGAVILFGLGIVSIVLAIKGSLEAVRDKRTGPFMVEGTIIGMSQSMLNKKPLIRLRTEQDELELLTPFLTYVNSYLHKPVKIVYLRNQRIALSVELLGAGNTGSV